MQVTIITPVYKVEAYLARCIESILAQTMPDFELLLIDDGSPDRSGEICDRYAIQDDRIRVFHTHNGGVSKARNLGLNEAKGDFIVFIDSDDWVAPNHLEQFLSNGLRSDGIAFSNFTRVWKNGDTRTDHIPDCIVDNDPTACRRLIVDLLRMNCFGWGCCKIYAREVIETHHIRFDEACNFAEDELFTAQYCLYIRQIISHSTPTYFYRLVEGSLTHQRRSPEQKISDWAHVLRSYEQMGYSDEMLYLVLRRHSSRLRSVLMREVSRADLCTVQMVIQAQRDVWNKYRKIVRLAYMSQFRDWRKYLIGHIVYCFPNRGWTMLMIKGLHL